MEPQRYLRCLGQPALFAPTGEPIRFRTRKHLALLVYLAVEQRTHRRDRLAEFLWPEVSATEARHSLATALSVLRPRVGLDALETNRDQVRLMPGRVTLDLDRLEAGDILGTEVTGPLEVAAFLDGFDITDSAEFTHWKDRQQARLLPIIKDAMLVLIDRCRRTGDTRQIEQAGRPDAGAGRAERGGDPGQDGGAGLCRRPADCAGDLRGVEEEAGRGAAGGALGPGGGDGGTATAAWLGANYTANIPNVPTDQWRGRPFIGRAAEYQVLYELWEGVQERDAGARPDSGGFGSRQDHPGAALNHRGGSGGRRDQPSPVLRPRARDPLLHAEQPDHGTAESSRGHGHFAGGAGRTFQDRSYAAKSFPPPNVRLGESWRDCSDQIYRCLP